MISLEGLIIIFMFIDKVYFYANLEFNFALTTYAAYLIDLESSARI